MPWTYLHTHFLLVWSVQGAEALGAVLTEWQSGHSVPEHQPCVTSGLLVVSPELLPGSGVPRLLPMSHGTRGHLGQCGAVAGCWPQSLAEVFAYLQTLLELVYPPAYTPPEGGVVLLVLP